MVTGGWAWGQVKTHFPSVPYWLRLQEKELPEGNPEGWELSKGVGTSGTCWACVGWFSAAEGGMGRRSLCSTSWCHLRARKDLSTA